MTAVEVLVASGVSALVATGVASLMVTGGRTLEAGTRNWAEVAALSAVLTTWPGDTSLSAPAPGWSGGTSAIWSTAHGVTVKTVSWTRPDGSPFTLSIAQDAP